MVNPNREIVGRLLLMSAATMTLLAVLAWMGVLPVPPEIRYPLAVVLGVVAALEGGLGFFLLTRS